MLDLWLEPSWASIIYQALRNGRLHEALDMFDEMRADGESPSHATYEMLIRGCAIGMRRVGPGEAPDHLTRRLLAQVLALFTDMQEAGRKPDYLTHIELVRALGKAGAVDEAMGVFEKMCRTVWLLPEERALNSMYELCVLSGHHAYALRVFDEHEELRKSLWRPRYTPVSFSLLPHRVRRARARRRGAPRQAAARPRAHGPPRRPPARRHLRAPPQRLRRRSRRAADRRAVREHRRKRRPRLPSAARGGAAGGGRGRRP